MEKDKEKKDKELMVALMFHGAPGYNRYNGHKKGEIRKYPEKEAALLVRDFPGGFTYITPPMGKTSEPIVEKKEVTISEHKMVDEVEEKKTEKKAVIKRRGR